jgi:hypothetical protein
MMFFLKPMINVIPNNIAILKTKANVRPILRALGRSISGNLLDTIEIKIMLSIPKTISNKVKVSKDNSPATEKISIIYFRCYLALV